MFPKWERWPVKVTFPTRFSSTHVMSFLSLTKWYFAYLASGLVDLLTSGLRQSKFCGKIIIYSKSYNKLCPTFF